MNLLKGFWMTCARPPHSDDSIREAHASTVSYKWLFFLVNKERKLFDILKLISVVVYLMNEWTIEKAKTLTLVLKRQSKRQTVATVFAYRVTLLSWTFSKTIMNKFRLRKKIISLVPVKTRQTIERLCIIVNENCAAGCGFMSSRWLPLWKVI